MTDWQAIVGRHTELVWQTAYRLLNNREEADDCVQETFLAALELARREPVRSWPGLLASMSTRRALDQLRRRARHAARYEGCVEWASVASTGAGPEEEVRASELSDRLREALAELPSRQAEAICLRCLSGLGYRDIARQLGTNTAAVGRDLYRARSRLRELLGPVVSEEGAEVSP